jgi:YidC/Oxa1 family membrane protein insertase
MTDMKRTLLWVVFLFSLFLIWDAWNKHNGQPSMFAPAPAQVAVPEAASASNALPAPAAGASGALASATPTAAPVAVAAPSEKVVVNTDLVKATFDTVGGSLVRLELLGQVDAVDRSKNMVLMDTSPQTPYQAQTGLISTSNTALPNHLTAMTVLPGPRAMGAQDKTLQVQFESPEVGGIKLIKTYTFKRGEHVVDVRHELRNTSANPVDPQLYLQLMRHGNAPAGESSLYFTFTGPALYTEASKFTKIDFKDIEKGAAKHDKTADNGWVAMVQHYFVSAWLLGDAKQPREFRTQKVGNNQYAVSMVLPLGNVAPGATKVLDARLFAGPQEEAKLAALAPGLELVKDYGWLTMLSKPLFWLLTELHKLLGNWGWAIVGLVLLLKIAFYWLTAAGYRSMAKMKAVNPRIVELNERYKNDPQKKSQEMMRIYREEKINPIGGCLPILVQMPFFIALYWVLLASVEMRNAPWIGWITDLSAKDPYFILPILMTLTTLLQTWLNPTPPDPMQAKMMWIMPLVFSVMFFFFPAGLVLYWLTNNILSIAQQYLINKQLGVLGK